MVVDFLRVDQIITMLTKTPYERYILKDLQMQGCDAWGLL